MNKIMIALIMLISCLEMVGCNTKSEEFINASEVAREVIEVEPLTESQMDIQPATITLIGHASVKIVTKDGIVIYIDPFYEGDYSQPADFILVTHGHDDHNKVDLVTQKEDTRIIKNKELLERMNDDLKYHKITEKGIEIEAVPASNARHSIQYSVGYIVAFDDIKVYHAGDTSKLSSMSELREKEITYAMFPIDGIYNMGGAEASECAEMVGAVYNIPIHCNLEVEENKPQGDALQPEGRLIIPYGESIIITP